ncbi:MAG: hypothetical protein J6M47_05870 [Clostridia bacterium]|nr:hypothetical protein [Clostridia bacterium]
MKECSWYKLLLCTFLVCFACLLVTGADRLIEREEPSVMLAQNVPASAYTCRLQTQSELNGLLEAREYDAQRKDLPAHSGKSALRMETAGICCDSNGNILAACSYMRAVYQAFALGDGFA